MTQATSEFSAFVGSAIRDRREALAARWVDRLQARLHESSQDLLPSDDILNHIPDVLDRVADYVTDPGETVLEAMVVDDLIQLASLRRRQGYGLHELLQEFHIFSGIVQEAIEEAVEDFDGSVQLLEAISVVGRLKDSIHLLGTVSARSQRRWSERWEEERQSLLEGYGQVIGHELGNRLGAAETAVQLLQSDFDVPEDRKQQIYQLVLDSIRGGMQTIRDVHVLSQPLSEKTESAAMALPLLVGESVRLLRARATGNNIRIRTQGKVPAVSVPGPPLRLALSNLLTNALKYHRIEGKDRWIEVRARVDGEMAEIEVEDNGSGIDPEIRDRIFEYRYRGTRATEGSGLGLAITRDSLSRVDGSVEVADGEAGGARFTIRIPLSPEKMEED